MEYAFNILKNKHPRAFSKKHLFFKVGSVSPQECVIIQSLALHLYLYIFNEVTVVGNYLLYICVIIANS